MREQAVKFLFQQPARDSLRKRRAHAKAGRIVARKTTPLAPDIPQRTVARFLANASQRMLPKGSVGVLESGYVTPLEPFLDQQPGALCCSQPGTFDALR